MYQAMQQVFSIIQTICVSMQKVVLEKALEDQQQAIIKKLQETPGQLQALSELSKTLDKLNMTLTNQSFMTLNTSVSDGKETAPREKGMFAFIKRNYLPICACGSFVSLLVLLILRILGL